jgi:hypothetical protein
MERNGPWFSRLATGATDVDLNNFHPIGSAGVAEGMPI